jgi:hypothetical protein
MKDFFVSYNAHDRGWAVWIAWHLEEAGYSVLIQEWDFVGNWVLQMDAAMRNTSRTIAVLSSNYLEALYTQPEWADAFRRDPTGTKDLLIPFRVGKCKLDGSLAQIVYTDLIDLPEEQARDRLLKRVSGQRGKPDVAPGFPGGTATPLVLRSVPKRPPYPAEQEDLLRLQRFRTIAREWRDRYASHTEALQLAARQARHLQSAPPPDVTDELMRVVSLAAEAADNLSKLPLDELTFARPYGLQIHAAVLDGAALNFVRSTYRSIQNWRAHDIGNALRRRRMADELKPVSEYDLENVGRVLEAAVTLCRFDLSLLPRGFVDAGMPNPLTDLRGRGALVLAHTGDERLRLLAPSVGDEPLGVFAARKLKLRVVAAQVNSEGSLDMIATDSHHLYYWSASGSVPVQQVRSEHQAIAGAFLSSEPGAEAVTVASNCCICVLASDGLRETVMPPEAPHSLEAAAVWVDPLDTQQWHAVLLGRDGVLLSLHHGQTVAGRRADELWNDAALTDLPTPNELGPLWTNYASLTLGMLDGLPCVVVERGSSWGSALCFVDPSTLQTLRRPMRIPNRPAAPMAFALAGGRWLFGTCIYSSTPSPRLLVWDLADNGPSATRPAGACFDAVGDTYDPVILSETSVHFGAAFVLNHFESGPKQHWRSLCVFDWPSGTTKFVADYSDLRLWPVRESKVTN